MRQTIRPALLGSPAVLALLAGAALAEPDRADPSSWSRALVWSPMCFPADLSRDQLEALVSSTQLLPPTQAYALDEAERFFVDSLVWTGDVGIGGAGQAARANLTYSFPDDGVTWGLSAVSSTGPNLLNANLVSTFGDLDEGREFIRQALASWRRITGLTYAEVADNNESMNQTTTRSAARGDIRIGGRNFGTNSFLAYNAFPSSGGLAGVGGGDMCINTSFFIGSAFNNSANSYRYLRNTVAHEHGHGLGNIHTVPCNGTKLMEPFIDTGFDGVQIDEIRGAARNYGDRYAGNNAKATAVNYKTLNNKSVREQWLSTNGAAGPNGTSEDWFKFKLTASRAVTITVTPTGGSYVNGQQSSNCSGSTSTINANNAGDLIVELRNASSVLQTSVGGGPGATETINAGTLLAGTYYIRVRDQGPNSNQTVQLYSLDIQVATKVSWPVAIAGLSKRAQAGQNTWFMGDINSYATQPGRTITKYDWDLDGDGVFETLNTARPVVQYTTNGDYAVKLRVRDSGNKTGTDTITVSVFGGASPLEADLTGDNRVDFADLAEAVDRGDQALLASVLRSFGDDMGPVILSASGEPIVAPDPTDTVARHEAEMAAEAEAD